MVGGCEGLGAGGGGSSWSLVDGGRFLRSSSAECNPEDLKHDYDDLCCHKVNNGLYAVITNVFVTHGGG